MTIPEYTKFIPLTQGKMAIVDTADYEWLNQWKWCFHCGYARRGEALGIINGKKKTKGHHMHRIIIGTPESMITDHINGNRLDNRRSNLRICDDQQNSWNQKSRKGTSKYKGISWKKQNKKWCVQITIKKGIKKHIGLYSSETRAIHAYNKAARKYHGEFAWLNKI